MKALECAAAKEHGGWVALMGVSAIDELLALIFTKLRVPEICEQDNTVFFGEVPGLMLERIVEDERLSFHPYLCFICNPDCTGWLTTNCRGARDLDSVGDAQPGVRDTTVRFNRNAGRDSCD